MDLDRRREHVGRKPIELIIGFLYLFGVPGVLALHIPGIGIPSRRLLPN